jgi:cytochrome P450
MFFLLFAGHETTTQLISRSVYELLNNPSFRDWLRAAFRAQQLGTAAFSPCQSKVDDMTGL